MAAACPFCGGEVEEDLITFGGSCPKCFAHIPGEEAATDPGEEVKAQQDAQDRRRSAFRSMLPIVLMVPIVMCAGVAATYYALKPEPEVAVLDFDELDMYPMPEIVAAPPELAANPGGAPDVAPGGAGKVADAGKSDGGKFDPTKLAPPPDVGQGGADLSKLTGNDGVADAGGSPRPRNVAGGPAGPAGFVENNGGGGTTSGDLDFGLDVSAERRGLALDDPDQIRDMIAQRMQAQLQTLNICYERELKVDATLTGKWRIKYTVQKDGTVADAGAEGLNGANASFEKCMADQLIRWRFVEIVRAQPVQKTLSFRPK